MKYQIMIEPEAQNNLRSIFDYISDNDSVEKAENFIRKLQKAINTLSLMPQRCRNSFYIEDGKTKDLIYYGYTVCYHIEKSTVYVVAVFRQR
jgi:plasmid stabilization system protein ParE